MKTKIIVTLGLIAVAVLVLIAADLPISKFPNTPTPNDSDLFVLAQTQAPPTNKNIRYDQLRGAIQSGLATENYVNNATNGIINVVSNFVANSSVAVHTNKTMLVLQQTPVSGSQWYVGTNGTPTTNEARSGLEFNAFFRSLRAGQVDGGPHVNNMMGDGSNAWNNTNLAICSIGLGSNGLAQAAYSSVLGGVWNGIRTGAVASVISGGNNNQIDTNAASCVIAGGGKNWIRTVGLSAVTTLNSTIGGGSNNVIGGTSIDFHGSTISGGGDNLIEGGQHSLIAGGFDNQIATASDFAAIGGGRGNRILQTGASSGGGNNSYIGGGFQNGIRGQYGFIGGGNGNSFFGNISGVGADYNVICGGASNNIGVNNFPSTHCFIGGGHECDIANDSAYSVIVGGANNSITGGNTNGLIGGGRFNTIGANKVFSSILSGERSSVNGSYSFAIGGASNQVDAARAGAIGHNITNTVDDSVIVGNLVEFRQISVVAGAGSGSTNYTLQAISPKSYLGSSNVNIVAVMQTVPSRIYNWSVIITNLSADTWGISFSSATNRWKFQSYMYGTNQPLVLTNNTLLRLHGESEGTNTLITYEYFRPAL